MHFQTIQQINLKQIYLQSKISFLVYISHIMDKKKWVFIIISVIVCLLVYLPTPKGRDPQEYEPAEPVNLDEIKVSKNKFDNAVFITTPAQGAEDVEIDNKGYIYSGLGDGSIIRIKPDNSEITTIAKSEGHIFGIDINSRSDKLALADQVSGIKILDLTTGKMQNLVSQFNGTKFASPNAVVFGQNDQYLYFTVSSDDTKMSEFHQMLLYSLGTGRIFGFNIATKQIELLADGLYFVNGLEYSAKDNCLYFVQTSRSRVMKMQLQKENRGKISLVIDNIFGYPDNVKLSQSGDLWVALPALRDSFSNIIDSNSIIRRVALNLRMPLSVFLKLANMKYAGGIKVNPKTGQIVQYFFGEGDKIDCISGINQRDGKVYLSSLSQNKIAVVDTTKLKKRKACTTQPNQPETLDQMCLQKAQQKVEQKKKAQATQVNCQGNENCPNNNKKTEQKLPQKTQTQVNVQTGTTNINVKVQQKVNQLETPPSQQNTQPQINIEVNTGQDEFIPQVQTKVNTGAQSNPRVQRPQNTQKLNANPNPQQRPVRTNPGSPRPNPQGGSRVQPGGRPQARVNPNQQRARPADTSQL